MVGCLGVTCTGRVALPTERGRHLRKGTRPVFLRTRYTGPIHAAQYDDDNVPTNDSTVTRRMVQPVPGSYDIPPGRGAFVPPGGGPPPPNRNGNKGDGSFSNLTKAFVAGSFILGMGAGIWFASEVTFAPQNVASTVLVDTKTPNSEVCMANGYSSMVFDQRLFVSFNPFNVYVSQPEVKPGCVLRRANFNVLESRGLVDSQQVQDCKRNMNTFAFVGDLTGQPQVSCVYHSEEAENQFLRNPDKSILNNLKDEERGGTVIQPK